MFCFLLTWGIDEGEKRVVEMGLFSQDIFCMSFSIFMHGYTWAQIGKGSGWKLDLERGGKGG